MRTITVTTTRKRFGALLDAVQHEPVLIRLKNGDAWVVISAEEYRRVHGLKSANPKRAQVDPKHGNQRLKSLTEFAMPQKSVAKKTRLAHVALMSGEAFQRSAERLIPRIWELKEGPSAIKMSDELGDLVVCATNLSFALELYLKALLTQLDVPVAQNHDLRALYDGLPQSVRALIEDVYNKALLDEVRRMDGHTSVMLAWGPPEKPRFEDSKVWPILPDLLARSKDLFQSWRYAFEFSPPDGSAHQFHRFEYCFLRCVAEVMRVEVSMRLAEAGLISPLDPLSEPECALTRTKTPSSSIP
jgi:prevent-host-death family protein